MTKRRRFGAIRRLPSGRYQVRWQMPTGEYVAGERTFPTKATADRFLADVERNMLSGRLVDPRESRTTVAEWGDRWMRSATHLKPKTRASYGSLLRAVIGPTIGGARLSDLRPMYVREWVAGLTARGLSPSRVRQAYRLLSQLMSTAQLDGLIASSPCIGVRLPRVPEHEPEVLKPEQVAELAGVMPPLYRLFTLTLAYTGLRWGEAAGLRRRFVDPSACLLVVATALTEADGVISFVEPKSHQHRVVTLPQFLADALRVRLDEVDAEPEALIFTSPDGLPLRHPNFMRRVWYPACKQVGVKATPHDLRASHATWLYDAGWSPVEIGGRLGHSKATVTTKHYARRVAGRDVEIARGLNAVAVAAERATIWHADGTSGVYTEVKDLE